MAKKQRCFKFFLGQHAETQKWAVWYTDTDRPGGKFMSDQEFSDSREAAQAGAQFIKSQKLYKQGDVILPAEIMAHVIWPTIKKVLQEQEQ